jgi:phosphomevalonate kinase
MRLMKVSAPGKILWIGSYSVVFNGISHVIAVNRRVHCKLKPNNEWIFDTSYGRYGEVGNELIESVMMQFRRQYGNFGPYYIELYNDPEFVIEGKKTGLGSSSAATVALTACLYYAITGEFKIDEIHKIAQRANYYRQKGIGSGFDIAAATYGSIVYRRFKDIDKMDFYYKPLLIPEKYSLILGFTGQSSPTVNLVQKFIENYDNPKFRKYLELIEIENTFAIRLLEMGRVLEACEHVRLARNYLIQLAEKVVGIKLVSEREKELIKIAEMNGAIISLSPGAGGGDSLFAIGEDLSKVISEWSKRGLKVINVKQDRGLRIDEE